MALNWAENTIVSESWINYDENSSDNLIADPRIRDTDAYISSINSAHEAFLNNTESKTEVVQAELNILHLDIVKNSLDKHLEASIPRMIEESIQQLQDDPNEHPLGMNSFNRNLRLSVKWRNNDLIANDIIDIFAKASELWIVLDKTLEDVVEDLNRRLSTTKDELELNRDTIMNDNLDFVLANYETYKDFIVFTKSQHRRGVTPGKIIENEATQPLIVSLTAAGVDIREFVDAVEAAREIQAWTEAQQERQQERQEHLQIASLYNQAMNPTSTQFTQASPANQPAPVSQPAPEIVEDTPIQVASADETTTIPNPAREEMDNLVASVDFSSNKYNDIYTTNPELVEAIQSMLGVEETGSYDADTFEAVKAFQTEKWLAVDGLAGPNTLWIMIDDKIPATITDNPNTQMASLGGWFNPINDTIHLAP